MKLGICKIFVDMCWFFLLQSLLQVTKNLFSHLGMYVVVIKFSFQSCGVYCVLFVKMNFKVIYSVMLLELIVFCCHFRI